MVAVVDREADGVERSWNPKIYSDVWLSEWLADWMAADYAHWAGQIAST